jgi:23S rRNA G2069 N7-methylase RlmK/C1962 C5-methylase RlmI
LRRHPWVFDSAIAKGGADPGETVRVESHDGAFLAWAAFSPSSRIRARCWSFDADQRIDAAFFEPPWRPPSVPATGSASTATACGWCTASPTACRA